MTGTEALVGRANESKQKANEAFKARRFHNAVEWYTEAIRLLAREALHCDTDEAVERWALAFRAGNDSRPTEDGRKGQEGESVNDRPNSAAAAAASGDRPSAVVQALVVLYANRALARIKVEEYGFAISDAGISIALSESEYPKAFYRRASALFALGRYKQAMSDFKRVLRAAPQDMEARAKLKECERRAREKAFAAAIDTSSDAAASPCLTADMSTVPVDADYTGPRIVPAASRELDRIAVGDGSVTRAFCEQLLEWYRAQHKLPKKYVMQLVTAAYVHLREYPSLVDVKLGTGSVPRDTAPDGYGAAANGELSERGRNGQHQSNDTSSHAPILLPHLTVCGDTHGQFFDLLRIFEMNGLPSADNPYLFNGDFVDRGSWSVEVIVTLLAFLVHDPRCMHLVRGNHESLNMNMIYGFQGEVRHKYTEAVFQLFEELFRALPLGYVIEGAAGRRALVLHGGLFSQHGVQLQQLRNIDRFCEPPTAGLMSELLWSDPQKESGWGPSKRGVGVSFGPDVTQRFLDDNALQFLIRSHEMKDEGYEVEADGRLITIFSAPNYCDQMGNKGAFIRLDAAMQPHFVQFAAAPHPPDVRPMMYASNGMMGLM
ncbi:hypothetical protein CDCA_CDCA05G1682 [Cyanidium caldarium]|uniref:Serine/threonine-protein phosphatase n=1 Tax=Cyanidium caldarium TaxID=2771 RepID=A0AAV9ITS4_CYACA|nr:hypothetical protein CDCA_CDCA05G1682 [Cyanidium caldarium]